MKPQIDTTKPIQMSCADRGGNAIGLWFDVVLIHMTDKHAYGYTADTNEQMSQVWKFTEWKFRNKPEEPKKAIVMLWRKKTDGKLQATVCVKVCGITIESVRRVQWNDSEILSVVEVDLPEHF